MAKRTLEEVGVSADVKKRPKKSKVDESAVPSINGSSDDNPIQLPNERLSKEERKALKRAKKEQAKLDSVKTAENLGKTNFDETTHEYDLSKKEQKELRRHEKAARKARKTAKHGMDAAAESKTNSSGTITPNVSDLDAAPELAYREHEDLKALSQSGIDAFFDANPLSIEDPLNQPQKPIISFDFLPGGRKSLKPHFAQFAAPTPIQAACWPHLFAGRDVIGVAETGSGKTLAFGMPCIRYINRLGKQERMAIRSCVVSPTRELALQIYEQLAKLGEPTGLKVTCVYGGVSKDEQREQLKGSNIIVATPGRLNDFLNEGSIDLSNVSYLVLDEADRMLDKGFEEEVRKIISATPPTGRQTLMFTATWPPSVRELASTFMDKPVRITIGDNASGELRANTRISQEVQVVDQIEKQGKLIQLLKQYQSGKNRNHRILVFCLYKKEATRIEEFIRRKGFPVAGIHGDLSQQKRTESLEAFKQGHIPLLVATDVAARGLDIPAVKVVINVTFPLTVEDYVHRIGRTGRAGQDGKAITFFTQSDKALSGALINVLKAANQPVPEDLMKFGTTVKKKGHEAYGAFFKDTGAGDMKKATKITFD